MSGITVGLVHHQSGQRFQASGGRIRLGRGKECELRPVAPDDTSVSRVHAEIVLRPDGTVVIRDHQSRNGTFVNGERVSGDRKIAAGDCIRLGPKGLELTVLDVAAGLRDP
jgi:pSer/pThr/pTyr-binding forkhead associated (FHA) protein